MSFKYRGLLAGTKKPKLPVLYRMREDLSWDDVVSNWKEMKPSITGKPSTPQLLHPTSPHLTITTLSIVLPSKRPKSTHAPKRHWKSIENRRAFFTKFAEEMGFDPLVPENWHPITKKQIKAKKVTNKPSYLKAIFTYCNNPTRVAPFSNYSLRSRVPSLQHSLMLLGKVFIHLATIA